MNAETVTLDVKLQAFVRRETKRRWIAVCPSIGVASQGDNMEDAKRSLHEAVELWFESCIERGVLDQAMRESNFQPVNPDNEPIGTQREYVVLNRRLSEDEDVRGRLFHINVEIPAYQAAALLAATS